MSRSDSPGGSSGFTLAWLALVLLVAGQVCAQPTVDSAPRDASTCVAEISVQEDRFVVTATVVLSPRFKALAPSLTPEIVERRLTGMLQEFFRVDLPLSIWIRPRADVVSYLRTGKLPAQDYSARLKGPLRWADAMAAVRELRIAHLQAHPGQRLLFLPEVLRQIVGAQFFREGLPRNTPLRAPLGGRPDNEINNGRLQFMLADPIAPADVAPTAITFNGGTASRWQVSREALARRLRPLVGDLWTPREIQVRLADFYAVRGAAVEEPLLIAQKMDFANAALRNRRETNDDNLLPQSVLQGGWKALTPPGGFGAVEIAVMDFADGPRAILVAEPPAVGEVMVLIPPAADGQPKPASLLPKLFHATLDDDDWERFRSGGTPFLQQDEGGAVLFVRALPDRPGLRSRDWNLAQTDLQRRSGSIAALDYGAMLDAPLRDEDGAKILLQPLPRTKSAAPAGSTPPRSSPAPLAAANPAAPDSPAVPRKPPRTVGRDYRHFLRVGAARKEGQGGEFDVNYRQVLLEDRSAAAEFTFGTFREAFGDASLKKDYVFFDHLGRRLGLEAKTYSSYTPDRPVGAAMVDERRAGGSFSAEIEVWRARRGHWLQARLDALRERVETLPSAGATQARHESSATAALTWFWQNPDRLGSPAITVSTSLRAARTGGTAFQIGRLDLRYHQPVIGFLEVDAAFGFARATAATPVTSQPQLGGSASVRGYRESAAIGTETGFAQMELWVPLRCLERRWPKAGTLLRRQLFAAVFVDAGGFDDPLRGRRTLLGAGLGVRFRAQRDIALKLDIARGLTDTGAIRGGTRLHFDAGIDFPF